MNRYRVLVADDDRAVLASLHLLFKGDHRVEPQFFEEGPDIIKAFREDMKGVSVILLDCHWGIQNPVGVEIARKIREMDSSVEIIMMSADLDRNTLKSAYEKGQINGFIDKPLDPVEVTQTLEACFRKYDQTKRPADNDRVSGNQKKIRQMGLEGVSNSMAEIWDTVESMKSSLSTILIQGENGTGKEAIARAFHDNSLHSQGAFVALNCGAISPSLIEGELFGHVKESFTNAYADSPGVFRSASHGTLFLDEVAELSLDAQVKLLRALEQKEVTPVGSAKSVKVKVRVVAATHRDLQSMVANGTFREDLYFRLNIVPLRVPPLRERTDDIKPILLSELKKYKVGPKKVLTSAIDMMEKYHWPGNVRELVNMVERWANLVKSDVIAPSDLDLAFFGTSTKKESFAYQDAVSRANSTLRRKQIWDHLPYAKSIRDLARRMRVANSTAQAWLASENIDFKKAKKELEALGEVIDA